MNRTPLRPLVHRLVGLVGADPSGDLTDTELLERFRTGREEAAFTLLVQRHGPAVLGVCRRLLGDSADVDDVFQATFLVLLRNSDSIRKRASLASWLHGVARRIAFKVRERRASGALPPDLPAWGREPAEEAAESEIRGLLDEEIGRLPECYRAPLILCGLEGLSCAQAAQALGWPKSTVSHRVHRARDLLRGRLLRHGVVAPAALLTAVLASETAPAAVPALMTLATVRLAAQVLAGSVPTAAPAWMLAKEVRLGVMPSLRLLTLAVTALLGLAVAGAGLLAGPRDQPEPATVNPPAAKADAPAVKERTDREGFPLPADALARVGSARLRHGHWLQEVAYSPDGKLLASSGGKAVRLWNASTGMLLHEFPLIEERGGPEVRFTADGGTFVLLDDQTCRWFDVQTGKETRHWSVPSPSAANHTRFAPHGEALMVADLGPGKDLVVYDLPSGKERFRRSGGESATWSGGPGFSADGTTLAALGSSEGKFKVHVFQASNGQPLAELDPGNAWGFLALSSDGKRLAGSNFPKTLRVWEVPSGKLVFEIEPAINAISATAFTPNGKAIVVGTQDLDALLLDAATGKELRRFRTYPSSVRLAATSDSKTLAIGTVNGEISQWDLTTGKCRSASATPIGGYAQLAFDRDGKLLCTASEGYAALDWRTGRVVRHLEIPHHGSSMLLACSANRSRIVGTTRDKKLAVWDATTGKELCTIANAGKGWFGRAFSPDGQTLYTAAWNGPIRVWDAATGRELPTFDTGKHLNRSLVVSPDNRWLAAADHPQAAGAPSRDVTVWDLPKGREAFHFSPPTEGARIWGLAFSPDNQFLAATGGSRDFSSLTDHNAFVSLWDLRTGKIRMTRAGLTGCGMNITFADDGRLLATGTGDNVVHIWEIATGTERRRFPGHTNSVHSVAFSADGKLLAAASADAPVYVWDVTGTADRAPLATPFTREEEDRLWKTLTSADAAAAFQTMRPLLARPGPATALLGSRLRPASEIVGKTLEQHIHALDADDFATRQRAAEELKKAGEQAEPLLRQALQNNPSPEARRQMEQLLEALESTTPEQLRQIRAVEVLEHCATDESRKLLAQLAGGARDALLTREAKAALERLARR